MVGEYGKLGEGGQGREMLEELRKQCQVRFLSICPFSGRKRWTCCSFCKKEEACLQKSTMRQENDAKSIQC